MKKIAIIASIVLLGGLSSSAQEVLFSVDGIDVQAEEFISVYEKNRSVGANIDPKTPEEYLDLYINFKLKIAEALEQKRDTSASFQREFNGYRAQLAKPYLSDPNIETELMHEAYDRLKEEVRASHIMIAVPIDASPADTARAYKDLVALRNQILSGKVKFGEVARKRSDDTWSAQRGGDLGYFTAFNMVYPFENAAYNLEVGAISMPVRSQFGYHLVQLTDRRPASGKVKVRHIFFAAGEEDALEDIQRAERSANEVYRRLQAGERFGQLVNAFSEDRKTNKKGGELPVFGLNEMMPEFEAAAFALKNTGDFSAPVRTSIGFHVIELVEKIPLASYDDLKGSIAQQVKRDSRSTLGAERFLNGIKKAYHLKIDEARYTQALKLVDEKLFLSGEWKIPALKRDYNVVTWDGGTLTQTQLLDLWSTKQKPRTKLALEKYLRDAFEAWVDAALIAYEDQQLESKYPDFKHLVREYKEGILLFDLTQDEVWNKAASDSAGIAQEYELIKNQYKWNDRISFEYWVCKDIRTARKIAKWSNKGKAEKIAALLAKEEALDIVNKKGLSQREDDPVFMDVWSESVGIHGPVTMSNGKYGVLKVMEFIPEEPKQLKEIRGIVIGSYQDRLEQQWIGDLKKKFEVTINGDVAEKVLQKLK